MPERALCVIRFARDALAEALLGITACEPFPLLSDAPLAFRVQGRLSRLNHSTHPWLLPEVPDLTDWEASRCSNSA